MVAVEKTRQSRLPTPTALVVDDSNDMRSLLREVLESAGWRVTAAGTGQRALRLMAVQRPDVVLIDLLMPGMSGFALRSAMLRDRLLADIPVVILSAYWRRPPETLDAAAILRKPVNIDRLLEVIDGVYRSTRHIRSVSPVHSA